MASVKSEAMLQSVRARLAEVGDPDRALAMAAYLKTDEPMFGVRRPDLKLIVKDLVATARPETVEDYTATVTALWEQPHREERYVAIGFARACDEFVDAGSVDLYARMIVEGAWWDLVDEIAIRLVGRALEKDRIVVTPMIHGWISSDDPWLRRTSIICQVTRGPTTDRDLLSDACTANLADTDFFIRKAIGWSLRDFGKADPSWVRSFIDRHGRQMSGLSLREASKYL